MYGTFKYIDFLFLGIGYFVTAAGKLCSYYGLASVDDAQTCRVAAKELSMVFKSTENQRYWPKGCYYSSAVFFNHHSIGSWNIGAHQICEIKGKAIKYMCHPIDNDPN